MTISLEDILPGEILAAWKPGDPARVAIHGEYGSGKTTFALTTENPIVIALESNIPEAVRAYQQRHPERKAMTLGYFPLPMKRSIRAARQTLDSLNEKVEKALHALNNKGLRATFVYDSVTKLWDLCQYAYVDVDEDGKAPPAEFSKANENYLALINGPKDHGHNVIMTARIQDNWKQAPDERGRLKLQVVGTRASWQKHTGNESDIVIEVRKTEQYDPIEKETLHGREYQIRKCTANSALYGAVFKELDWEGLMMNVEYFGK